MATSVNSATSTSTLSSLSAKTGMAGLVSGLDTDSLVESLTSASRAKITKQQQNLQLLEWKQSSYRGVSKVLKEFQSKYLDVLSTNNFRSAAMFNAVSATASSTKVAVSTTSAASAGTITVNKISQLATNQKITSAEGVSKPLEGTLDQAQLLSGINETTSKSFLMKLDGKIKTITLDQAFKDSLGTKTFEEALQTKLKDAFGTTDGTNPMVGVDVTGGQLSFTPMEGSTLSIHALNDDTDTLKYLGLEDKQSNKMTTSMALEDLTFKNALTPGADGKVKLTINSIDFEFDKTETLSSVMSKINASDAGVTLAYSSINDQFTMTAKNSGAGDNIVIAETAGNLMTALGLTIATGATASDGVNAKLTVNGKDIIRTSNTVDVDGVKIELKELSNDAITVTSKADATSLKDTIKSFVEDYNNMIETMNKLVKEDYDTAYPPLTDDQKAEMSEKEIESWEAKAKVGLLRGDKLIKGIANQMQSMIYGSAVNGGISLYDLGISSAGYAENGKLKIDEDKLTTAIETKSNAIQELFTTADTGLAVQLNDIITSAVKTSGVKGTRGSLIEMAGYESTLSNTENNIYDDIQKINKNVTKLKTSLKDEETRYWSKFTALETALQQLNTQSSILTQFSSGA
ncbi:flagellar filament capping protein FliD [Acetobacterium sp. UBA5834]|jgi:flagellar hook-associated protein 2|uniref:flagellar filament capping protein FliD n=1 Tax=Acetobacterium sp. UBA5834 TaxID=1945907 RepID=UPI00257D2B3F|nr:flagellar filament capping protein FliD [Acetobacterium sp. UBA5834]